MSERSGAGGSADDRRVPRFVRPASLDAGLNAPRAGGRGRVLELFETRYPDFTAKHFHEKLVCEHGFGLSYRIWLRNELAGARQDQAGIQARTAHRGSGRADRWWG